MPNAFIYGAPIARETETERERDMYTQFGRFFLTSYKTRIASDASETTP